MTLPDIFLDALYLVAYVMGPALKFAMALLIVLTLGEGFVAAAQIIRE